jgi:Tol biopolymer transport system component
MRRLTCPVMLGAALLTVAPAVASADVFNGRISFTSFRDGDGEIFTMTPHGGDLRQLTSNESTDAQADWAPDGRALAWRIQPPDRRFQVARMDASGGEYEQLTRPGPTGREQSSQPSWFPDGGALLFRRSGTGIQPAVWRVGTHGEDPKQLLTAPGRQWYPSFSPDMTRILFAMTFSEPADTDRGIVASDPAGLERTVLFNTPVVFDSAPAWSPDGGRVAFESDADPVGGNPEGDREIFVMNADGTAVRQLTHNAAHDEGPAWSPDGTMLARTSGADNTHGDIRLMTDDGEELGTLTDFEGADESPDWQAIPAPPTDRRCGDVTARSDDESGLRARDVRAAGRRLSCKKARSLAARWLRPARRGLGRFDARVDDYGGTLRVQLTRDGRCRAKDRLVAFIAEPH